jgi:hypothetical protein
MANACRRYVCYTSRLDPIKCEMQDSLFWEVIMASDTYDSFCPVAKACDIIEPRWTLLILCELSHGATRFNEIRRGVPGIPCFPNA